MTGKIRAYIDCTEGATAIEYALIGSIIALSIIVAITGIGGRLSSYFSEVSSALK